MKEALNLKQPSSDNFSRNPYTQRFRYMYKPSGQKFGQRLPTRNHGIGNLPPETMNITLEIQILQTETKDLVQETKTMQLFIITITNQPYIQDTENVKFKVLRK